MTNSIVAEVWNFSQKNAFFQAARQLINDILYAIAGASAQKEESISISLANKKAEMLMDRYGNHILRFAYSYMHNMYDAEEVLQDTMVQYLKKRPVIQDAEKEKAWLLRVASNLCKNKLKYNKIRVADELSDTLVREERQDLSFVWDAVKQLPPRYRAVIHLFYYEGYQTSQIAEVMNRKESTIRSDLHRGRESLKNILKEEYDFEESI